MAGGSWVEMRGRTRDRAAAPVGTGCEFITVGDRGARGDAKTPLGSGRRPAGGTQAGRSDADAQVGTQTSLPAGRSDT